MKLLEYEKSLIFYTLGVCCSSNDFQKYVESRALNFRRDTPDLIRIKNTPVQVGSIFFELTPRRIKARGIWTPVKTILHNNAERAIF